MGCWTRTNDFFLQEDTELIAVKKSLERGSKNGRWSLSEINTLII